MSDLESLRLPPGGTLASSRRRRWPLLLAAIAVLVIGYAGWRTLTAAVEVEAVQPTLEGSGAAAGSPVLTSSGYVVARRRAVVSAKIQGRLAELLVEEGARVEKSAVFARLESADFQAAVNRAKAEVESAAAQVGAADAQEANAKAQILRAEADLAEAERQLRVADRLNKEQILPTDQLDATASRVKVAQAAVAQTRADLERARADRLRVVAERAQADANVRYNEALLQNTIIRAPFTGTVVRKMAEVGESVAPIPPGVNISTASGAIVALADLDTLEVEVDVAEANVARLQPNQPAEVIVEAFPDRRYKGVLRQVIPTADRTRATVMVKVTILDKDANLKPEMSAKVTFLEPARSEAAARAGSETRVVLIPQAAVVTRDGAPQVFTIVGGVVKPARVTLGATRQDRVIVTEGLSGQETIVASPPESLKPGDRVRLKST